MDREVIHRPPRADLQGAGLRGDARLARAARTAVTPAWRTEFDGARGPYEGGMRLSRGATSPATAIQSELDASCARRSIEGGRRTVVEGASLPCTPEAARRLSCAGAISAPGGAASPGGEAVSALETKDDPILETTGAIHRRVQNRRGPNGRVQHTRGASVAAILRVTGAPVARGII